MTPTIPREHRPFDSWLIVVPMAAVYDEIRGDVACAEQAAQSYSDYFDSIVLRRRFTCEERRGAPVDTCLNHSKFMGLKLARFECGCGKCRGPQV